MFAIERASFWPRVLLEDLLCGDALAGGGPHVGDVEIVDAVVVVIEPADTHPRADIFRASPGRDVGERSVAIVAIQIFSPEIVHDVEVRPAVAVEVAPTAAEAITRVVLVETRLLGNVAKRTVAVVAQHEIGRPVLGRVIRTWIFVLIRALVIGVKAEINIEPAIAIVIGGRRACESSLWRIRELKGIRLEAKFAPALVEEQERTGGADDNQILTAVVVEVRENGTGGVFEEPDA